MSSPEDPEIGEGGPFRASSRIDTSSKVWSVYLSVADKHDKALAESWKGDTEGIIYFTGLFAVTVAAFVIESSKRLSSDSGAATVLLLNQISQQFSALSNGTQVSLPPPIYSDSSFRPAPSAIRINILWFLSLTLSVICALAAILIQQWSRHYTQSTKARTSPHERARTREYLFEGVQTFALSRAVGAVLALLHVAVFLFFAGLVDFLFSIDSTVGRVILGVVGSFGCIYIFLTFLPNIRPNCPYRMPLSQDAYKWLLVVSTAPALLAIHCLRYFIPGDKFTEVRKCFQRFVESLRWTISDAVKSLRAKLDQMASRWTVESLRWTMSDAVNSLRVDLDQRALRWTVETVEDDDDIETLIEGIPEFLDPKTSKSAPPIVEELFDHSRPKLGQHIDRLIQTCTTYGYLGTNENLRRRRALICLDTTRILSMVHSKSLFYGKFGYKTWLSVHSLGRDKDPAIAINAISTSTLAAWEYLCFIFKSRREAPHRELTHIMNLRQLINAPWQDANSFPECHLLVLHGFVSGLLDHLISDDVDPTSFRAVWETLPWILNVVPLKYSGLRFMESFLALCAGLEKLAGTKRVTDADDSPVIRLMSMLRPMIENIRVQHESSMPETSSGNSQEEGVTGAPPN